MRGCTSSGYCSLLTVDRNNNRIIVAQLSGLHSRFFFRFLGILNEQFSGKIGHLVKFYTHPLKDNEQHSGDSTMMRFFNRGCKNYHIHGIHILLCDFSVTSGLCRLRKLGISTLFIVHAMGSSFIFKRYLLLIFCAHAHDVLSCSVFR